MYNVLISVGVAFVFYGLGAYVAGALAGLIPALIAFIAAYFLLARRTGKQVEIVFKRAMEQLQGGDMVAARVTMRQALVFGRWQFLVAAQVESQLGALSYLEAGSLVMQKQITNSKAKFTEAKLHLDKAWSRDWRGRALLACCFHREGNTDEAVKAMAGAESGGSAEPLFYAVWAYILNEAKRRDESLQVVGRGLKSNPKSAALTAVRDAMANRKRPDFLAFGEGWYQFFPEQIPQEVLIEQARAAGKLPANFAANNNRMTFPQPRR